MKIAKSKPYRSTGQWQLRRSRKPTVTRAALIRAFSTPDRSRSEVLSIVARFIGTSPVPPGWGRLGVRGTFGKKVERLWSRRIKRLNPARYRSETGKWLHPVIQTLHDFGISPDALHDTPEMASKINAAKLSGPPVIVDEFHQFEACGAFGNLVQMEYDFINRRETCQTLAIQRN